MLQEAHHIFSFEGALLLYHVELAIEGDGAHRRKVISGEVLLEDGRLSHRSIGANHHGQQIEARLVAEDYGPALRESVLFSEKATSFVSSVLWPPHPAAQKGAGVSADFASEPSANDSHEPGGS